MNFSYVNFINGLAFWQKALLILCILGLLIVALVGININSLLPIVFIICILLTIIIINMESINLTQKLIEKNIDFFKDRFEIDYNHFVKVKANFNDSLIAIRVDKINNNRKIYIEKFIPAEIEIKMTITMQENNGYWIDKRNNGVWYGQSFDSDDFKITENEIVDFLKNFK